MAGLVAITPACGYVSAAGSLGVGAGAGLFAYLAVTWLKPRLGYDDSLDVFGVHGVGGVWGAIATGLWATTAINDGGGDGLFYGNAAQLWVQIKAVGTTCIWSGVVSLVLWKLIDGTIGLRASDDEERIGMDLTDHAETAYTVLD